MEIPTAPKKETPLVQTLVERIARELAIIDGHDPDETWNEFDRSAALACDHLHEPPANWEEDVFPKKTRWKEYEYKAQRIVKTLETATPSMQAAAWNVIDRGKSAARFRRLGPGAGPINIWKAMLHG